MMVTPSTAQFPLDLSEDEAVHSKVKVVSIKEEKCDFDLHKSGNSLSSRGHAQNCLAFYLIKRQKGPTFKG